MAWYNPTEEARSVIEFWIKTVAYVLGSIGAFLFGTAQYQQFDEAQKIKSNLAGDTNLVIDGGAGLGFEKDGREYCQISGQYSVTNIGLYGFYSDEGTLKIWELPFIDAQVSGDEPFAYAMSSRIDDPDSPFPAREIDSQVVPVKESFAPNNRLERAFGLIFPIDATSGAPERRYDSYYAVEANASAALRANKDETASFCGEKSDWPDSKLSINRLRARFGDPGVCFNKNDLRHNSKAFYCKRPKQKQD